MPTLDELVRAVRGGVERLPVRAAWVFGSRVRGHARVDSDLDVAIAFDHALDARTKEDIRRSLVVALADELGAIGERADVVDLDVASTSVAFRAIREGVLAYERSKAERVQVMVRVMRRYDDAAPHRARARAAAIRVARAMGATDGRS
jgi:predicted nucleotidyltransferase